MSIKSGANFQDQNEIKKLAAAGFTAEQISRMMSIDEKSVAWWVNHFQNGGTRADESGDGMSAADVAAALAGEKKKRAKKADNPASADSAADLDFTG